MSDESETEAPSPHGRFQRWLQLVEADAQRRTSASAPKPRCIHGRPWDDCADCGTQHDVGGEA